MASLGLIRELFLEDSALDTAVSRALLERVAAGELPETLRLARPGAMVTFAKQDAVSAGYAAAARAARERGFEAVLRLAGGRAAVFHEGTVAIAHAAPDADPRPHIHERFRSAAALVERALRRLGVDARVGEVPGEYCPGGYSVNARGRVKLAGLGQRLIRGGAFLGGVIVAAEADRLREVLVPVYAELGLSWDPATAGAVEDEAPGASREHVVEALLAEYSGLYELEEAELDRDTLALASGYAGEHRAPEEALR